MKRYQLFFLLLSASLLWFACERDSYQNGSGSDNTGQGGSTARFTIRDNYLYTVDTDRLKTYNISTPEDPVYLENKDQRLGFGIETIFVMDSLLFIGSQNGMYIYNVIRPEFPQLLSFTSHITSCDPVVASGNYAYVTLNTENFWCGRNTNELQIYNIANPEQPELIRTESGFIHPRGLGIDRNKLFVCDKGLKIYDVANPGKPVWVDDLSNIPEVSGIDAYDVIPFNGKLLLIGADGFYQFDYTGDKLAFISKIEVLKNK